MAQPDDVADMTMFSARCEIIDATERGLILRLNGQDEAVTWNAVTSIAAGRGRSGKGGAPWLLVLALGIELDGEERVFVVAEDELVWLPLTEILHTALPGVPPFEVWGADAVTTHATIVLYRQDERAV